jgi:hypothetical protein
MLSLHLYRDNDTVSKQIDSVWFVSVNCKDSINEAMSCALVCAGVFLSCSVDVMIGQVCVRFFCLELKKQLSGIDMHWEKKTCGECGKDDEGWIWRWGPRWWYDLTYQWYMCSDCATREKIRVG